MNEPSPAVENAVMQRVLRDLEPPRSLVYAKTGFAVGTGGALSLFFCGQFGYGLTPLAELISHGLHHRIGIYGCTAVCGALFTILPVTLLRLISSPLQFRAISRHHQEAALVWLGVFGAALIYATRTEETLMLFATWLGAALASCALLSRMVDRWSNLSARHGAMLLLAILMTTLTLGSRPAAADEAAPRRLGYEDFAEAVATGHPEADLDSRRLAIIERAKERAGQLSDPQLAIGRSDVELRSARESSPEQGMMSARATEQPSWRASLSQTLPWPGTLAADEELADARARATRADIELATVRRRFAAKELFLDLVKRAKLLGLAKSQLAETETTRKFAEDRFRQGIGSHLDAVDARTETELLKAKIAVLTTELDNARALARLWLGPNHSTAELALDFPKLAVDPERGEDQTKDLGQRQIAATGLVEARQKDLQARTSLPNFTVTGEVMQMDSGMQTWGAMVGIQLPLFSTHTRSVLADEATLVEQKTEAELAWYRARRQLAERIARSRIEQAKANLEVLRTTVVPTIREHHEASVVEYTQGRGTLASIIRSRRSLLDYESEEIRLEAATLLAIVGHEKVLAGLVDESLDPTMLQLSVISPSSSMGAMTSSEAMTDMRGSERGRMKASETTPRKPNVPSPDATDEGPAPQAMPGMGM